MKPLAIVPTYVRNMLDTQMLDATLRTLRETASDRCDVMVVDDGSPERDLIVTLRDISVKYEAEFVDKEPNEGFGCAVNIGLRRCLEEGRDAVLVNSDIEFGLTKDWLGLMQRQRRSDDKGLASIVGALLLYPNGTIQHSGVYFSILTREFGHRFNYGPGNLPEAQVATVCPVTGALMFIRHECLEAVGLFDESFRLGWEDVDMNVRAWLTGRETIYQPGIRAVHHESYFRGRRDKKIEEWTNKSWLRFVGKYADVNFAQFVPNLMAVG